MTGKIDISPEQLAIVQGILKDHLPKGTLAWAFGSRVTWTAKPFSDLDIALEGAAPLAADVLIDLEEAFEASDLPWKVDVIDLNAVSPEFRAIVERQRVPADWEDVTLGDVARRGGGSIQTGPFGSQLHASDYKEWGVPVIMPQNISTDRISTEGIARVAEEDAECLSKHRVKIGDIVYSRRGDVERRALVRPENEGWLCGTGCLKVRLGSGVVVPEFAAFFLSHPASKAWVVQHAVGATMPNLNTSILSAVPFVLPPLDEQQRIADTLSALDDKIELNRRMNETLEAMARAVFRDWFVDFGPTRRKAAGLTDPAAILGHLLPDSDKAAPFTALFPDSFGANGLPEGWEEREIGDLCPIVGGGTPSTKEPAFWDDGTHNWATPKDLSKLSGLFLSETERQVTDAGLAKVSSGLSPVGSVLLSSRAPIGYVAIAEKPVAVNQGFIVMQPTPAFPTEFAYFWTLENLDLIKANANGSTFQEISKKNFRPLRVNHAGEDLVAKFAEVAGQMMNLIRNNQQENQTLAATRDLLLPKLMSGEIRLTGAEGLA
ncbi:restriction endonuclease subunit S [Thalassovita sp.]|uniref:restriction endonuclease subunit S n=1 Tax=Thalassovita sp. TaxID=1979401 RepID=UPI0029DE72ED|nr:restriction endonuclease subunit S [Thalassovita sp.]